MHALAVGHGAVPRIRRAARLFRRAGEAKVDSPRGGDRRCLQRRGGRRPDLRTMGPAGAGPHRRRSRHGAHQPPHVRGALCRGGPSQAGLRRYSLHTDLRFPGRSGMAAFWRLGLPMGITQVLDSSIFYAASNMMGWLGAEALAAHVINLQIMNMLTTIRSASARPRPFGSDRPRRRQPARHVGREPRRLSRDRRHDGGSVLVLLVYPRALLAIFITVGDPSNTHVVEVGLGARHRRRLRHRRRIAVHRPRRPARTARHGRSHDHRACRRMGRRLLGAFLAFTLGMGRRRGSGLAWRPASAPWRRCSPFAA